MYPFCTFCRVVGSLQAVFNCSIIVNWFLKVAGTVWLLTTS